MSAISYNWILQFLITSTVLYAVITADKSKDILTFQQFQIVPINNSSSSEKSTNNSTSVFTIQGSKNLEATTESDSVNHISKFSDESIDRLIEENGENGHTRTTPTGSKKDVTFEEIDNAVRYGMKVVDDLIKIKEPMWYKMGLYLEPDHPASRIAQFGKPNKRAIELSKFGLATLEASKRIAESFLGNLKRQIDDFPLAAQSRILQKDCPLQGTPRCLPASKKYRTSDGTCNNFDKPWKGSSMQPLQRFLPPAFEDGIQSVRRSVRGPPLPSPRKISQLVHRDRNVESKSVTLMFMQWGQLIDHDITSSVKSRGFNGTVPRCCDRDGGGMLPPELTHPACLPIEIPEEDTLFRNFGIGCFEFIRSAPSTRINCDFGWREQLNQATAYIDASTIYGSEVDTQDSLRTFDRGKIIYGPIRTLDSRDEELCTSGALTSTCFQSGDSRVTEQPGLIALHTVWVRFHNKVATTLSRVNPHWSDEKTFQETRKIIYSLIQHITYHEFLPIVLGPEVMELFELNLEPYGFYKGYDIRVDPTIANSFTAAAFRFGHSLVQNSFMRTDSSHRPLADNVSLHEEPENLHNIWSIGSVDRLLLGFCNQPSQRRDEFICSELSGHLFQRRGTPFGMDLPAVNIQRGRDHGIPAYTAWRSPCGLSPIENWRDLEKLFSLDTIQRLRSVYLDVEDIDLFSGGLAEKPVRGGIIGPTFACIIAQQFLNLRKGDRFWYENGGFESSFTRGQLQQIRRVTLANIFCQTFDEIRTIQPYVFLAADDFKNARISCNNLLREEFDLSPWIEDNFNSNNRLEFSRNLHRRSKRRTKQSDIETDAIEYRRVSNSNRSKPKLKPLAKQQINITYSNPISESVEINIKFGQTTIPPTRKSTVSMALKKKRPTSGHGTGTQYGNNNMVLITGKPPTRKPTKYQNPTSKPAYSTFTQNYQEISSFTKRPYQIPTDIPEVVYPVFVQSQYEDVVTLNNFYDDYPSNPDKVKPAGDSYRPQTDDDDFYEIVSTSYKPLQIRPSNLRPKPPTEIVVLTSDNTHDEFSNKPYRPQSGNDAIITSSNLYEYPVNGNKVKPNKGYHRPLNTGYDAIETAANRPSLNYGQATSSSYNLHYSTSSKPVYYEYDVNTRFPNKNKPYDRIDDVYSQLLVNQDNSQDIPKKPSFGDRFNNNTHTIVTVYDKFGKPYSVSTFEKVSARPINDRLDFKTTSLTRRQGNKLENMNLVRMYSLNQEEKEQINV